MLETLDHTIRIGRTKQPTFLYFDLYKKQQLSQSEDNYTSL